MTEAQILVVEDESIVGKDIQNRLRNMGYRVPDVTASGEEAINKVAEIHPDLVLMDIMLKGKIDGIAAAEKIRNLFNIPVVYLTAYSDEHTLSRAKLSEPFGYLLKPFEERELYTTIEMALYKHKMERKLKESEQWLATTLRSIGDGVIATDRNGRVAFMNPVAEDLTGWRQPDALGKELSEIFNVVDERSRNSVENPAAKVLRGRSAIRLPYNVQLVAKDGSETPVDDSAAPILDSKGNISGVVLAFRDITERRVAEEVLRQHAQYLVKRVKELHCLYAIFRIAEKPGLSLNDILSQSIEAMSPAWKFPELTAVRLVVDHQEFKTANFQHTQWMQTADIVVYGNIVGRLEVYYLEEKPEADEGPFLKEERSLLSAIALQLGHVIERKRTEESMQQRVMSLADTLRVPGGDDLISYILKRSDIAIEDVLKETLKEVQQSRSDLEHFAMMVLDDLDRALRIDTKFLNLLNDHLKPQNEQQAREIRPFITEITNHIYAMINDMLFYSRVKMMGRQMIDMDVQQILEQVLKDLQDSIRETRASVTHDPMPKLKGNPSQLAQLFANLITNAIQFRADRPLEIHIGAEKKDGHWQFYVRDNGIGIEPEQQETLFNIQSRWRVISGGIGLIISKKIVDHHEGDLWVESQPGEGTTFYFTIPER